LVAQLEQALQALLQESWDTLALQQEELNRIVQQTRQDLEREQVSFDRLRERVTALDHDLDRYSRQELRELFTAIKDREVRLVALRSEAESLEYRRVVLAEYAQALSRFASMSEGNLTPRLPTRTSEPSGGQDAGALLRAEENERGRLAARLHDQIAQPLHHLVLRVELWQRLVRSDPNQAMTELEDLRPLATQLLRGARRAIFELRPMSLDDLGLAAALEQYVQVRSEQDGLTLRLHVEGRIRPLAPEIATAAFRIVQAALDNVREHASVSEANITLSFTERELGVTVSDAGRGCSLRLVEASGHGSAGLLGMRERAHLIGGRLQLDSAPGRGMTVRLTVPLVGPMALAGGARRAGLNP
jgi:two-component system, NarL family, sensor histidine kinase DegS